MKLNSENKFIENEKSLIILTSAEEVIKCVVCNTKVSDRHKGEVISLMIWMITERHGKWNTRYRSEKAKGMRSKDCGIRHDHVYRRKDLIDCILKDHKNISAILESAIACVVTKEEHERLNQIDKKKPYLKGWDRYKEANITVYDMQTNKVLR